MDKLDTEVYTRLTTRFAGAADLSNVLRAQSRHRAEFEAGVRRLGLRALDSESINALFDSWDTDGSGYLSLLEFNSILRRGGYPRLSTHARIDVIDSEPGLSELEESNHKLSETLLRHNRLEKMDCKLLKN